MDAFIAKKLGILLNSALIDSLVVDRTEEDPAEKEIVMTMIDIVGGKNKEAGVEVVIMRDKDHKEDIENLDLANIPPTNTEEESIEDKDIDVQNQDLIQDRIRTVDTVVEVKIK